MSFTFPAALAAILKSSSVSLDWAMLIYYYNGVNRTNAIGLSSIDRIIGTQQYYGIVQNWGEIVNSIDLKESKASAGSFSITCSNKWKGGKFTDELYGGTNTYLNAKVLVYMGETSDTTLANWQLLGEYRLANISASLTDVQLEFEERTPWDKIKLPIEKQSSHYYPLVYGDFTPGTGPTYLNSKVWPCPIYGMTYDQIIIFLYTQASGGISIYYYEPSLKLYIPVTAGTAAAYGTSIPADDGKSALTNGNLRRDFDFYTQGQSTDTDHSFSVTGTGYIAALSDGNILTYAYDYESYTGTSSGYHYDYLCLQLPQIEGVLEDFDVAITFQYYLYQTGTTPTNTFTWDLFDVTYNSSATPAPADATSVTITNGSHTADGGDVWSAEEAQTYTLYGANQYQASYSYPSQIKLCFRTSNTNGGNVALRCRVTELKIQIIAKMEDENGGLSNTGAYYVNTLKYLYSDEDGPVNAWDSSAITEPQQIHRELLQTKLGLATGDIDAAGSWANIETIKNGWSARFWELEPLPLKEILEQLQMEGGFIAFWSGQKVKYVCVEDSYATVTHTLTENDYQNLSISISPIDDIVTQRIYQYNRDPATDTLLNGVSVSNVWDAAARTKWNIATNENVEEIELKYLVACVSGGANPNSSCGNYYANILESPKLMANCDIVNPLYFDLEQGDIIKFNDTYITPFGKIWANTYLMLIETRRSKDKLNITAREVYYA